jgi:hypothetical protein
VRAGPLDERAPILEQGGVARHGCANLEHGAGGRKK